MELLRRQKKKLWVKCTVMSVATQTPIIYHSSLPTVPSAECRAIALILNVIVVSIKCVNSKA